MSKRTASQMEQVPTTISRPSSNRTMESINSLVNFSGVPTPMVNAKSSQAKTNRNNSKGPPEKKRSRSRLGCHRCKKLKVKCDEIKPSCTLCEKANKSCDYSLKLTWGGRPFKDESKLNLGFGTITSFEMKYNPENVKNKKEEEAPQPQQQEIKKEPSMKKDSISETLTSPIIRETVANLNSTSHENAALISSSIPKKVHSFKTNMNYSAAAAISSLDDDPFSKIDFNNLGDMNVSQFVPLQLTAQAPIPPHTSTSLPLLQRKHRLDVDVSGKISEVFQPLDSYHVESLASNGSETLPGQSNITGNTGLRKFDDFASAFKDLDTSNLIAKRFVTDFLLPEFFEDNQLTLNTKPSKHHSCDSTSEDSNTPPENQLVVSSSFHTYSSPSSTRTQLEQYPASTVYKSTTQSTFNTSFMPHNTKSIEQLISPDFKEIENLFNFNIDNFITLPQQIPPLPDLLLKNPRYREYYHHYVHTFSKTLVPANASSYTDNPFTCLLPRLSMSSNCDGLLSALIAMCISQRYSRADIDQSTFPKGLISDLLSRALNDLYNCLTDPRETQSDYTLGLILVMTCFDIIRGSRYKWRAHYHGARKIVMSRGFVKAVCDQQQSGSIKNGGSYNKSVSFERGEESDLMFFFSRWFAYLDTFGLLVSSSHIFVNSPTRNLIKWAGPKVTRVEREKLQDIDRLMGFDFKLLDFFAEIISLIDEREKNCRTPNNLTIDLMQRALDVKASLLEYISTTDKERDEIEITIKFNPTDPRYMKLFDYSRLRATNNVFALSGVLQIYRRVLMMSTQSDIVQDVVNQITVIIQDRIPDDTTAANCTMFALFTAGCEAIDIDTRAFYLQRLTKLIEHGATGARDAYDIMLESWESGKFWADILSEKNMDIMFS